MFPCHTDHPAASRPAASRPAASRQAAPRQAAPRSPAPPSPSPGCRSTVTARLLGLGKEIAALRSISRDLRDKYELPRLFAIEDEYRLAMFEAEHAWVGALLDDLASGELYWDSETIRAWAQGLQDRMGSFPGIPRRPSEQDLPP